MISSGETVRANVRGDSPGVRSETTGVGFVKQVGFKPGVKERERELRVRTGVVKQKRKK